MAEDSPVDYSPSPNPPIIQETPATEVPPFITPPPARKSRVKFLLPLILLVAFLPIATGAVLLHQSLSGEAAFSILGCRIKPASVKIHPGKIQTTVGNPPIGLSALAYDNQNRPIWKDVTYEWGMSSTTSIGNLIPNGNLATFIAQSPGRGDIYAIATYCRKKAIGSSSVIVLPVPSPSPTIGPRPSYFPTPTRAPTMTPRPSIFPTPSQFPTPTHGITPTPVSTIHPT